MIPVRGVRCPKGGRSRGRIRLVNGCNSLLALDRMASSGHNRDLGCKRPDGFGDHPLNSRKDPRCGWVEGRLSHREGVSFNKWGLGHRNVQHSDLKRILRRSNSNISGGWLEAQSRLRQSTVEGKLHHGQGPRCGLVW